MGNLLRDATNWAIRPLNWSLIKQSTPAKIGRVVSMLRPVDGGHSLIRIGGGADGGYLLPDDLAGITACFSPGVGDSSRFELDLERRGIKSFLADASVKGPAPEAAHMDFDAKFLGAWTGGDKITLDDWVASKRSPVTEGDLMLQMDIEGAEYEVLLAASQATLRRFRIITLELHWFERLGQPAACHLISSVLEKLAQEFVPVHLHPNNHARAVLIAGYTLPPLLEVTYLRRDRCLSMEPRREFPHAADRDNVVGKPPLALPRCFYA
jgi:Methyltransferase FkbM domain